MCDCGDAIGSVMSAQSSALSSKIEVSIAAKQLSAAKEQGQAIQEMLESAARVGKSLSTGASFDAQG